MAPIKFEENIKEKLEKRTLEPSANAWANLEQQLKANSKKKNKTKFWWFGVAASVIGLLFVVQYFMPFGSIKTIESPKVVTSKKESINKLEVTPIVAKQTNNLVQETEVKANVTKQDQAVSVNKKGSLKTNENGTKTNFKNINNQQPVVANKAIVVNKKQKSVVVGTLKNSSDVAVVAGQKSKSKVENTESQMAILKNSEAEIDQLLFTANKKIQLSNTKKVKSVTVDANRLLEDAETEMPPSLRKQLFKVIEKNFKTATTAVSTRNE